MHRREDAEIKMQKCAEIWMHKCEDTVHGCKSATGVQICRCLPWRVEMCLVCDVSAGGDVCVESLVVSCLSVPVGDMFVERDVSVLIEAVFLEHVQSHQTSGMTGPIPLLIAVVLLRCATPWRKQRVKAKHTCKTACVK